MKIFSLDISSRNTGWAFSDGDSLIEYGEISPPGDTHPKKLHILRLEVMSIIARLMPELIAVEDIWAGANIGTMKILALYHGIVYQLSAQYSTELCVLTPSKFRKILGASYGTLIPQERQAAKAAVATVVSTLYPQVPSELSDDITDAIGICIAARLWVSKIDLELVKVTESNPKIRSKARLLDMAEKETEKFFASAIESRRKSNAKSMGNTRSVTGRRSSRRKKGVQSPST